MVHKKYGKKISAWRLHSCYRVTTLVCMYILPSIRPPILSPFIPRQIRHCPQYTIYNYTQIPVVLYVLLYKPTSTPQSAPFPSPTPAPCPPILPCTILPHHPLHLPRHSPRNAPYPPAIRQPRAPGNHYALKLMLKTLPPRQVIRLLS